MAASTKQTRPEGLVSALQSFSGWIAGKRIDVHRGELFDAEHPAVHQWPGQFGPVNNVRRDTPKVEQATAAPGEQRP